MKEIDILASPTIHEYQKIAIRNLKRIHPEWNDLEIQRAVEYSIQKRFQNTDVVIDNNYKRRQVKMSLLETCDYILQKHPILCASGVLFKRHADSDNLMYQLLEIFINSRKENKATMYKYPIGSELFNKYNLAQLLDKRDVNAAYGANGQPNCIFYNLYVAASTTTQGRSSISASILFFEAFLSNNVKFHSLNEIVTFIDNVVEERFVRKYKDKDLLDRDISVADCFYQLTHIIDPEFYVPSEKELDYIWKLICSLSQEDINRLYYKNNLYGFMSNNSMYNAMRYILESLDEPFLSPNEIPDCIKVELDEMYEIVKEYVYYGYQTIDRLGRAENMGRNVCIIIDTDSTIVSFDAWYKFVLNKMYDVPMTIKNNTYGNEKYLNQEKLAKKPEIILEYDGSIDGFKSVKRIKDPLDVIPQDSLRYSIINILANFCGRLILDFMYRYTVNSNTAADDRKCLLIQKNEYLFKRALVTDGKKHYASYQEIKEGNIVPKNKSMAISGLELTKDNAAPQTQEDLQDILYRDILDSPTIDRVKILKDVMGIEKKIKQNLLEGKREYLKPVTIKSLSSYAKPMSQQGIKAAIVYNNVKEHWMPGINLEERNSFDVLKVKISKENIIPLRQSNQEIYDKIINIMNIKEFANGINVIALPTDVEIPEWLKNYIDFDTIINDNLKLFPIETLGFDKLQNKYVSYTNILKL